MILALRAHAPTEIRRHRTTFVPEAKRVWNPPSLPVAVTVAARSELVQRRAERSADLPVAGTRIYGGSW